MNHNVFCIGFSTADPQVVSAPSGLGEVDDIAVPVDETVALISSVSDAMGLTFSNLTLSAGDTVSVVGARGSIPDYQSGMFVVANADGVCYFPNAGHLAAAFSAS